MQFKHRKKILNLSTRDIETKNGIYTELYVEHKKKISSPGLYSILNNKLQELTQWNAEYLHQQPRQFKNSENITKQTFRKGF